MNCKRIIIDTEDATFVLERFGIHIAFWALEYLFGILAKYCINRIALNDRLSVLGYFTWRRHNLISNSRLVFNSNTILRLRTYHKLTTSFNQKKTPSQLQPGRGLEIRNLKVFYIPAPMNGFQTSSFAASQVLAASLWFILSMSTSAAIPPIWAAVNDMRENAI